MDIFLDETLPSNMYSLLKDHLKEGLQNAHSSIKEQAQKLKRYCFLNLYHLLHLFRKFANIFKA